MNTTNQTTNPAKLRSTKETAAHTSCEASAKQEGQNVREHAPLPWSVQDVADHISVVCDTQQVVVAREFPAREQRRANAEFIVEACNNYEKVTAQRDELLAERDKWLHTVKWILKFPVVLEDKRYVQTINELIANSEGKQAQ